MKLTVLVPPSRVPVLLVHVPEKVCVSPDPKTSVPPFPLIIRLAPLTFPVNVALPEVLVIDIRPVVVMPSMLCAPSVPANVILELPACNPVNGLEAWQMKLPSKVRS